MAVLSATGVRTAGFPETGWSYRRPDFNWASWALPRPTAFSGFAYSKIAALVLVLAVALGIMWVHWADEFFVAAQTTSITGQELLTAEEIHLASQVDGWNVFWLNGAEIAQRVMELPLVQRALVKPALPGRVHIQVVEREPIVLWMTQQGQRWVDAEGVAMPVRSERPGLIRVIDGAGHAARAPDLGRMEIGVLQGVLTLHSTLPEVETFWYSQSEGLHFTGPEGVIVYMGWGSEMAQKVQTLKQLRQELGAEVEALSLIDLRFRKPYFRR